MSQDPSFADRLTRLCPDDPGAAAELPDRPTRRLARGRWREHYPAGHRAVTAEDRA